MPLHDLEGAIVRPGLAIHAIWRSCSDGNGKGSAFRAWIGAIARVCVDSINFAYHLDSFPAWGMARLGADFNN
jgi:hypothetical protein